MRARWIAALVVASCFGPYLGPGVRTEQVLIYPLAVLTVTVAAYRMRLPGCVFAALAGWTVIACVATINTITMSGFGGAALAGLDALAMPLAVALIVAAIPQDDRYYALRTAATVLILGACSCAVLAFAQSRGVMPDLFTPWLPTAPETTGARAATLGRWTGVLNQPALAGCLYSLGLIVATWRVHSRLLLAMAWALLAFGGVLAASKAFLWAGLPIALWHLLATRFGRGAGASVVFAGAGALGVAYLTGAFGGGFVGEVTGNRYGSESSASVVARLQESIELDPLGHGLAGMPWAADSQWLQVVDFAGLFGAVLLVCVLIWLWLSVRAVEPRREQVAAAAVLGLVTVTGAAFPVLTGNRAGPLVWVVLLLALSVRGVPPEPEARSKRRVTRKRAPRRRVALSQPVTAGRRHRHR